MKSICHRFSITAVAFLATISTLGSLGWGQQLTLLATHSSPVPRHGDQAFFSGIAGENSNDLSSFALAISADGTTVVGNRTTNDGTEAFRWTKDDGTVSLGDIDGGKLQSSAVSVSDDGSVIVGYGHGDKGKQGLIWNAGKLTELPADDLLGTPTNVVDVDNDGKTMTGHFALNGKTRGYVWNAQTGYQTVESTISMARKTFSVDSNVLSISNGICVGAMEADGVDMVNACFWIGQKGVPFRSKKLREGVTSYLGDLGIRTVLIDIATADRDTVLGLTGRRTIKKSGVTKGFWVSKDGELSWMETISGQQMLPTSISKDGLTVVGNLKSAAGPIACVWTKAGGVKKVVDLLANQQVVTTGWKLTSVNSISSDGTVVAGSGTSPRGKKEGWVANLGPQNLIQQRTSKASSPDLKAGSVWQGTCNQEGRNPYPMEIRIERVEGNEFSGTTFYSTLPGEARIRGTIDGQKIRFTEYEKISGRLAIPCEYSATLNQNAISGRWRFRGHTSTFKVEKK